MRDSLRVFWLIGCLALVSLALPGLAQAQEKYAGPGTLEIWSCDSYSDDDGDFAYRFMVDGQGLAKDPNIDALEDFIIASNYGEIAFEGSIKGGDGLDRYDMGILYTSEEIKTLKIIKVVGVLKGKAVDLTDAVSVRVNVPVKIQKEK
ncbi:MAG: hypothetical protein LBR11_01925 [Deltaproteobacteria bacterium]|jgi:hypothetical protein|nr:hypothetical protein [Deltaproteobacteria bacterium]